MQSQSFYFCYTKLTKYIWYLVVWNYFMISNEKLFDFDSLICILYNEDKNVGTNSFVNQNLIFQKKSLDS